MKQKTLTFLLLFVLSQHVFAQCWTQVTAGWYHSAGIQTDGTLWAWGRNTFGQLGDGTTVNKNVPTQIGTDTNWAMVSAGNDFTVAIKTDGTLWSWGRNNHHQLGDGLTTTVNRSSPAQVGTANNWQNVQAGDYQFTIALKTNGTIWSWGFIGSFLGLGDEVPQPYSPTQIGTATDYTDIEVGYRKTVARKTDNTYFIWGENTNGSFGNGTTIGSSSPIPLFIPNNWEHISLGFDHSLFKKNDGTIWSCGGNIGGELGLGITSTVPGYIADITQIGTANDWAEIDFGIAQIYAIKNNGSLWVCGYNTTGQLGIGTTTNVNTLTQIGTASNWQKTISDGNHCLAFTTNGNFFVWGDNTYGQLGDGTFVNKLVPTQIGTTCNLATSDFTENAKIIVYPNPAENNATISFPYTITDKAICTVANMLGQTVYKTTFVNQNELLLNCAAWQNGVYTIQIITNTTTYQTKFIKNN